jgi:hypothetical protein
MSRAALSGVLCSSLDLEDHLHHAEHDLEDDQSDDVPLDPERETVLEKAVHGFGGAGDELQLAVERAVAVAQVVLVDQAGPQPLELGVIPEQVGLLLDLDATDHLVLHDEGTADVAQQLLALASRDDTVLHVDGEGLDAVEDGGDAGFVLGEDDGSGEDIGDELEAWQVGAGEAEPAAVGSIGRTGADAQFDLFGFGLLGWVGEERSEELEEGGFFEGGDVEGDHDAVAKEHGGSALAGGDHEGCAGEHGGSLDGLEVDAFGHEDGADADGRAIVEG